MHALLRWHEAFMLRDAADVLTSGSHAEQLARVLGDGRIEATTKPLVGRYSQREVFASWQACVATTLLSYCPIQSLPTPPARAIA